VAHPAEHPRTQWQAPSYLAQSREVVSALSQLVGGPASPLGSDHSAAHSVQAEHACAQVEGNDQAPASATGPPSNPHPGRQADPVGGSPRDHGPVVAGPPTLTLGLPAPAPSDTTRATFAGKLPVRQPRARAEAQPSRPVRTSAGRLVQSGRLQHRAQARRATRNKELLQYILAPFPGESQGGGAGPGPSPSFPTEVWAHLDRPLTEWYDGQGTAGDAPAETHDGWTRVIHFACRTAASAPTHSQLRAQAARLVFLLPRMFLYPASTGEDAFRRRLSLFWAGEWEALLPRPPGPRIELWTDEGVRAKRQSHAADPPPGKRTEPTPGSAMADIYHMVTDLVGAGGFGKAARLFVSPGLAPRTEDTFLQLWEYHPPGRQVLPQAAEPAEEGCAAVSTKLGDEQLLQSLRSSGVRGAGGPSLYRKAHLTGLLNSPEAFRDWAKFMRILADGLVPRDVDGALGWRTEQWPKTIEAALV
jgi:hypothetical protein